MTTPRPRGAPPAEIAVLTPDSWTEPFWVAAAEHRLVVPRCRACGAYRLPPTPFCHSCQSQDSEWIEHPGSGIVYSFTVVRHAVVPEVADAVPYVPAVVELDDTGGARLVAALVEVDPDEVRIGMPVAVVWDDVDAGVSIPRFAPAQ